MPAPARPVTCLPGKTRIAVVDRSPAPAKLLFALAAIALACTPSEKGAPPPSEQLPTEPVFYVDARTGADTNDGRTAKTAFKTLNRAAASVKPGWTVRVMSGTYTSDGP